MAKKDQATIKIPSARQSNHVDGNGVNRRVLAETNQNTQNKAKSFFDSKVISNVNLLLIIRILLFLLIPSLQLYKQTPFFLPLSILLLIPKTM